jgi:hypothetical protein
MPEQPSDQVPGHPDTEPAQPIPPASTVSDGDSVTATITAARAASDAASAAAARAASRHAAHRSGLAALLTAHLLPDAASLVFSRDEDLLTADTTITLVHIRSGDGRLLWYSEWTGFAEHPDARELGTPPDLDAGTLDEIESQLRMAYDASPGHFDTTADGAEVMPGANLLLLPVPDPASGTPQSGGPAAAPGAAGHHRAEETTAADVREAMREAAGAFLDTDRCGPGAPDLLEIAYTLAAGFRDLDTGTVLTGDGQRAFTEDAMPGVVHVLRHSHRHGTDISVHTTAGGAAATLAAIVRGQWGDMLGRSDAPGAPPTPDGLTDAEATAMYFDHQQDEFAEVVPAVVNVARDEDALDEAEVLARGYF